MRLLPFEYAARNLGRSGLRLALSVGGAALVVMLILAAASFVRGMDRSMRSTGGEKNVMLVGAGSEESAERSEISARVASLVAASIPGIETRLGVTFVSPEVHIALPLRMESAVEQKSLVMVRGVTPTAMLVHDRIRVLEGRMPEPGAEGLMVGALAGVKLGARESQVAIGKSLWLDNREWKIVGRFTSPGTVMDSEVWTTLADLKTATKRATDSVVVARLADAEYADVAAFCKQRLDLELSAVMESDYYARLNSFFRPIRVVAWITASLMAMGGILGGLNTMYAAFASRVREMGMLQCLGFRRGAIVVSLLQESVLAAAAGTLIACLVGVLVLDGVSVTFSTGAFGLIVDSPVLLLAMVSGLALGLVGALPPARRALGMPIPESLKSA